MTQTTELDKWFGPKKQAKELPPRKTKDELMASMIKAGSNWRGEPGVVTLLEAFETMVDPPESAWMRKIWYAGARDFYEEHGEDCELLIETARYLIDRCIIVESPRACIKTACWLKRKRIDFDDEAFRRSYLEGEL